MTQTTDKLSRKNWELIGLLLCILCIIGLLVYIHQSDKQAGANKRQHEIEAEKAAVNEVIGQRAKELLNNNQSASAESKSELQEVLKKGKAANIKPVVEVLESDSSEAVEWLKNGRYGKQH
jgi:uncharacterized protein HemX